MLIYVDVAVVTGLYLACYNIGNALGNTISGAVWTNRMPIELNRALTNQTLAASVFANPYGILLTYPFGTPERTGMLSAYGNVQMILASKS
jgi:SIT family siderophore-iron:H+ symporter-like MFS transporter